MAGSAQFPQQRVRFGAYEVDLRAKELWKAGRRRKLTGQPFAVLAILLERPGEVVSREELQKRLWPDTFVDVDHNLNTAINKIREALNDSKERPQYIETLSRRGYRFIAAVESVPSASPPVASEVESASSIATENSAIDPPIQEMPQHCRLLTLGSHGYRLPTRLSKEMARRKMVSDCVCGSGHRVSSAAGHAGSAGDRYQPIDAGWRTQNVRATGQPPLPC